MKRVRGLCVVDCLLARCEPVSRESCAQTHSQLEFIGTNNGESNGRHLSRFDFSGIRCERSRIDGYLR